MRNSRLVVSRILLILASLLAFFPLFKAGFVGYDDPDYVLNNPFLKHFSLKNMAFLLKSSKIDMFIPVTQFSYLADHSLGGMQPFWYHLNSILIHSLNCLLIFSLTRKLSGNEWASFFCALLFAVHPLHVESVAWISERKDLVYVFFYLLAFAAYVRFRDKKSWLFYGLSLLLFILSCLSKPMAITFPVALWLYDHFFLKRKIRETFVAYVPYLICAGWCAWNAMRDVGHGVLIEGAENYSFAEKILLPFYGVCFYGVKFFAPVHLSAIYPYPQKPLLLFAGAFALCGVLLFFVFRYRKQKPLLVAGMIFYIVTLLPVLQLIPNTFSIVADRYFYLSCLGIIVPLVFWLHSYFKNQGASIFLLSAAALFFCIVSFNRSKVWNNSETLFSDMIKKEPKEYRGYLNRGSYYLESGKFGPAGSDLATAYQMQPADPKVLVSYGWALLATTGNRTEAEKLFKDCIALDPLNSEALNNLGSIYGIQQEFEKALVYMHKAKDVNPFDPKINYNLGYTFLQAGARDSAVFYFRKAAEEGSEQAGQALRKLEQ
jgi:hypothetical protein